MALRFIDSFDHYSTNDLLGTGNGQKWTSAAGSVSISPLGRTNNCLLVANAASNSNFYVSKTLDNQSTWIVGFAFKYVLLNNNNNTGIILQILDTGTTQVEIRVNTYSNQILITRNGTTLGTSTNTLVANTWYYIEFKVTISSSISANTCMLNVNGVNWINVAAGVSTKNSANTTANQILLGNNNATSNYWTQYYDDVYICDGTGSTNNDFLGDCRVEAKLPTAVGSNSAWTTNGANGVGCVSDLECFNGDTNFISSATTNQISTFTTQALSSTPSNIYGVQTTHVSRKTDSGGRSIAQAVVSGATTNISTSDSLANSYAVYTHILETDPNTTAAWTLSAINAMEVGVKEIT